LWLSRGAKAEPSHKSHPFAVLYALGRNLLTRDEAFLIAVNIAKLPSVPPRLPRGMRVALDRKHGRGTKLEHIEKMAPASRTTTGQVWEEGEAPHTTRHRQVSPYRDSISTSNELHGAVIEGVACCRFPQVTALLRGFAVKAVFHRNSLRTRTYVLSTGIGRLVRQPEPSR
jgi:hypothetical protein